VRQEKGRPVCMKLRCGIQFSEVIKVKSSKFLTSAYAKSDYPAELYPEVACAGRSNVGKSSLINTLVNRKNLARTSSAPGKTQCINFYLVNQCLYLVDLPGYGFAKVPAQVRKRWRPMVDEYLRDRKKLCGVIVTLDSRVGPTPLDVSVKEWLDDLSIPAVFVMTKLDKLSRNRVNKALQHVAETLSVSPEHIVPFSAVTGQGKGKLWQEITSLMNRTQRSHQLSHV